MNVLGVLPGYPPTSRVGAFISTHLFLAHLATRDHQVRVLLTGTPCDPYTLDGVHVQSVAVPNGDHYRAPLSNWPIVNVHGDWSDVIVSNAGDDYGQGIANRACRPSVRFAHAAAARSTHQAALVVANSHETAATVTHGDVMVVNPPVMPADYRATPGDRVTLVNLSPWKGGPLFWWLSEALPDVDFLGVAGSYGNQGPAGQIATFAGRPVFAGNTTIIPSTEDMRSVYARTRVLLMPSMVESFGRVALEAACSGIPTIANPTPGLVEAMGDHAIWCDWDRPDRWADEIRRLQDPDEWAKASANASARAALLDPAADLDRFAERIETLVGVSA